MRKTKEQIRRKIERLEQDLETLESEGQEVVYPDDASSSVLTKAQREVLMDGKDISGGRPHERAMNSRIRDRTICAIPDLQLLNLYFPVGEREKISESVSERQIEGAINFLESLK